MEKKNGNPRCSKSEKVKKGRKSYNSLYIYILPKGPFKGGMRHVSSTVFVLFYTTVLLRGFPGLDLDLDLDLDSNLGQRRKLQALRSCGMLYAV